MKRARIIFLSIVTVVLPIYAIPSSTVKALGCAGGAIATGVCGITTIALLDNGNAYLCGKMVLANALATYGTLNAYQNSNSSKMVSICGVAGGLASAAFFGKAVICSHSKGAAGVAICSLLATVANIQAYRSSGSTIADSVSTEKSIQNIQ